MKIRSFINLAFFVILFFASCNSEDPIIGTWQRFGDLHAGMKIEVVKDGEFFKGTITFASDSNVAHGFVVNDVKWKNIRRKEAGKYEFENLGKTINPPSDKFEPTYATSYLELVSHDTIKTRLVTKGIETVGTEQQWKRVPAK